jgi:hypothetical protein
MKMVMEVFESRGWYGCYWAGLHFGAFLCIVASSGGFWSIALSGINGSLNGSLNVRVKMTVLRCLKYKKYSCAGRYLHLKRGATV